MQPSELQPNVPATGTTEILRKIAVFERAYNCEATAEYRAQLGDRFQPEVEVTYDEICHQYPYYLQLCGEHPLLDEFVEKHIASLQPFCQSPFLLPHHQVSQGPWLGNYKVTHFPLCEVNTATVTNRRVLDIGCNAGFDTFYLAALGPSEIIGIEPSTFFYAQAKFFWTLYNCPNVQFLNTGWENIQPATFGAFDLINCQGVLYHEVSPLHLLDALFKLLVPGGKLVVETHVTLDDDMKAIFVPGQFWGDYNWYWIPSLSTAESMLKAVGFEDVQVRAHAPVPSKNPNDADHTLEGVAVGGRAFFTCRRPLAEHVHRPKVAGL